MRKNKLMTVNKPRLSSRKGDMSGSILRRYDLGGALDLEIANTAAKQLSSVAAGVNDVNDKAKAIEEDIKGHNTPQASAASTEDLLNQWSAWNPISHISWKDLTNKGSAMSYITDMASNSMQGAASGAKLGPVGAIAGGVGGLISGFVGNFAAKRQAKKKAKQNNLLADQINLATQRNFNNQANQLDNTMTAKELSDFTGWEAAYGGPLFAEGGILQNAKKQHHVFGGNLMTHGATFDTGVTLVGNGGTHEENPNGGVPMGMDSEGIKNLVEEGEAISDDYVYSKRWKVPEEVRERHGLSGTKPITFADAALQLSKESEERPNDPISQAGRKHSLFSLAIDQERLRVKKNKGNKFAKGGKLGRLYEGTGLFPNQLVLNNRNTMTWNLKDMNQKRGLNLTGFDVVDQFKKKTDETVNPIDTLRTTDFETYLKTRYKPTKAIDNDDQKYKTDYTRFAPAFSQAVDYLKDTLGITNRPDFVLGKKVRGANRQIRDISTRSAGRTIGYKPTDMWAALNDFNSQMAAWRSALRNTGNRVGAAGQMLALAYNQNKASGDLYAGMEKENWNRLTHSISHNSAIDQANRNAEVQAAQINAQQGNARASNIIAAAKLDDAEESAYAQAKNANKNRFYDTLGNIGKERVNNKIMEALLRSGLFGTPNEALKEALAYYGISPKTWSDK